jgi:preprotein translocase subunit YajC
VLSLLIAQAAAPDAGASPGGAAGLLASPLPLILVMFAIFYFMIIRPQSKQQKSHQDFLGKLQKGDEVVTTGGLLGKVAAINDDKVLTLEIANNVKVRVLKAQIAGPVQQQPAADNKPAEEPKK